MTHCPFCLSRPCERERETNDLSSTPSADAAEKKRDSGRTQPTRNRNVKLTFDRAQHKHESRLRSISYCSADAANARVFAVVEGLRGNSGDTHIVHVFVCERRRHARALALALAHAFNDAYQAWQANQASTLRGDGGNRLAPWVRFHEESDEETDGEQWQAPPLVTFA
ncbi:Low density lipoprotein receptor adapter protein 1-A [Eumeta japonica]|uniref:Low density lipoprotein receptor adapter protein 1-A n=1 Tax=Eumeta variegata TaxID=151549 RepID=A0A4C1USV4_EUMVA|nr:Low density lipoprotein receptor adapter protein 1-A [Eumeta japonica]